MERAELLNSREYWLTKIQSQLFESVDDYRRKNKLTQTGFAKKLGVSKGYISQILNGDFDHRISKLVDISLSIGKVPNIEFKDLEELIKLDAGSEDGIVYSKSHENNLNIYIQEFSTTVVITTANLSINKNLQPSKTDFIFENPSDITYYSNYENSIDKA